MEKRCYMSALFHFWRTMNWFRKSEGKIMPQNPHTSFRTVINTASTLLVLDIFQANYSGYVMSEIMK